MKKYDVVIVGSGLGGLECATILSKEGFNVCVVEKNDIYGGCLQSFKRSGHILDTGIHYVGSLGPGQILHQYFKYFGLIDKIKLRRLDTEAFDVISYEGKDYNYALGFDNFAETISSYFPEERNNIISYTNKIKQIGDMISVENLRKGLLNMSGLEYFSQSASQIIADTVKDEKLQNVLAGTVALYSGKRDYSSFYHHAMINASNIEGAYRFVDGSQSIADGLIEVIRANGGTVINNSKVTRFVVNDGIVTSVEINETEHIEAKYFISNMHPALTFDLVDKTPIIKKAFTTRLNSLPNSYGLFTVYLVMKKQSFPYLNRNYYLHSSNDAWYASTHPEDKSIRSALLCTQACSNDEQYADVVTILSPMYFDEVDQWSDTTVGRRGESYREFKKRKAQEIVDFAIQYHPKLRGNIEKIHTSTPLTYRDYTGTPEGSAYGILKNCNNPLASLIPTRTKIDNLFLTGQNINVHGALGVTLTAAHTCAHLVGAEYLAKKIGEV